jgi:hypothetical protein
MRPITTFRQARHYFPMAGDIRAASLVGALNAVELRTERDRYWFKAYMEALKRSPLPASRDACSGFDAARRLIRSVGWRTARRWIGRCARDTRKWGKRHVGSVENTATTTRTKGRRQRSLDAGWRGL